MERYWMVGCQPVVCGRSQSQGSVAAGKVWSKAGRCWLWVAAYSQWEWRRRYGVIQADRAAGCGWLLTIDAIGGPRYVGSADLRQVAASGHSQSEGGGGNGQVVIDCGLWAGVWWPAFGVW